MEIQRCWRAKFVHGIKLRIACVKARKKVQQTRTKILFDFDFSLHNVAFFMRMLSFLRPSRWFSTFVYSFYSRSRLIIDLLPSRERVYTNASSRLSRLCKLFEKILLGRPYASTCSNFVDIWNIFFFKFFVFVDALSPHWMFHSFITNATNTLGIFDQLRGEIYIFIFFSTTGPLVKNDIFRLFSSIVTEKKTVQCPHWPFLNTIDSLSHRHRQAEAAAERWWV